MVLAAKLSPEANCSMASVPKRLRSFSPVFDITCSSSLPAELVISVVQLHEVVILYHSWLSNWNKVVKSFLRHWHCSEDYDDDDTVFSWFNVRIKILRHWFSIRFLASFSCMHVELEREKHYYDLRASLVEISLLCTVLLHTHKKKPNTHSLRLSKTRKLHVWVSERV